MPKIIVSSPADDIPPRFEPYRIATMTFEQAKAAFMGEPVQDGLLAHYNSQAPFADANVEKRLETEPFEWPLRQAQDKP